MSNSDPDDPRGATLVADAWQQFEAHILPVAVEHQSPGVTGFARLCFYFGAYALFGLYNAVLEGAESDEAVEVARDTLAEEFAAFLADHEADLH
jgi:hypothetical protein